jgi:hypothetical protein
MSHEARKHTIQLPNLLIDLEAAVFGCAKAGCRPIAGALDMFTVLI